MRVSFRTYSVNPFSKSEKVEFAFPGSPRKKWVNQFRMLFHPKMIENLQNHPEMDFSRPHPSVRDDVDAAKSFLRETSRFERGNKMISVTNTDDKHELGNNVSTTKV